MSPRLLPWVVFLLAGVAVNTFAPERGTGHVAESALTIAAMAVHVSLVALTFRGLEPRFSARVVFAGATLVAAVLGAAIPLMMWLVKPALFEAEAPASIAMSGAMTGTLLLGLYVLTVRYPNALEEVRALRLESELAAVRARFEPHFLLNALNAIAGAVGSEPERARRGLAALGDLLSDALENDVTKATHTVTQEVAWLRAYLTIFETRYGEALTVTWSVRPEVEALRLPRLVLQPLVENALKHGVAPQSGGHVGVRVFEGGAGVLQVEVTNSGAVRTPLVEGRGLQLVRRRLELEWPGSQLQLEPSPQGMVVKVSVPPRA